MKKYLSVLALLLLLSGVVNFKHEQYANKAASDGGDKRFSIFLGDAPDGKSNPAQPEDNQAIWWERGYIFFGWPNGITIWALFLTMIVIAEQTIETRKAAKATEDSVGTMKRQADIQAAAMSQWLDVECVASDTAGSPLLDDSKKYVSSLNVKIHFKAINNTAYPLMVKRTEISISRNHYDGKMRWENFAIEEPAILPPSRPNREGSYHFFINLPLNGAGVESYARDNFFASVVGSVFFEPVTGESIVEQRFGSIAQCGPSGAKFNGYWSKEATPTGTEEYQPER